MHIPDGFLSVAVSIAFWAAALLALGAALRSTRSQLGERQVPLMGVLAAAIFAGQMLNFAVGGGTSGHLLGAALAAVLLGPWPAVLVMTSVVSVQALVFQDGGILALGANIFNMGVVGVFTAWLAYRLVRRLAGDSPKSVLFAGFAAAWLSIFITSLACALQLAISGTSPASLAIPAMAGVHALIGISEGLITAGALAFLQASRPDLLSGGAAPVPGSRGVLAGGAAITLLLAFLAPLASSRPDGLEWVAERFGFLHLARQAFSTLIPDYAVPGIANLNQATIAAGVIGAVIVFALAFGLARSSRRISAG